MTTNIDHSQKGLDGEIPIGWAIRIMLEPYGLEIKTNPYNYHDYVREQGKGVDIEIPQLGIGLEIKTLSEKLSNGDQQFVSNVWLIREVVGGTYRDHGEEKTAKSRFKPEHKIKFVLFQHDSVCPDKQVAFLKEHDTEMISPNIELCDAFNNKDDLKKLIRFCYKHIVVPNLGILKSMKRYQKKYGKNWYKYYSINLTRYKQDTLSSSCTREDSININNGVIEEYSSSLVDNILVDRYRDSSIDNNITEYTNQSNYNSYNNYNIGFGTPKGLIWTLFLGEDYE